jgi:hypothetical protein
MSDRRPARLRRGEAALVAQYLHELSERHGGRAAQAARNAGTRAGVTPASGSGAAARASSRARHSSA